MSPRTPAGWRELLAREGLPPLEGDVLEMRRSARTGDWWARTSASGWFWLRNPADFARESTATPQWRPSHHGPP